MAEVQRRLEVEAENLGYSGFEARKTPELVFVFVEPIGGGAQQIADALVRILKSSDYSYKINPVSISELIEFEAKRKGYGEPALHPLLSEVKGLSAEAKRINRLQQWGNQLRLEKGPDHFAKKVIQKVFEFRNKHDGMEKASGAAFVPKPMRFAHVIRSIKNHGELALLKSVYGQLMILVGVSGDYEQHVANYRSPGDAEEYNQQIAKEYEQLTLIDQDEGITHGQQVRDMFYKSNLFLNSNVDSATKKIKHFLSLLFSSRIVSPTQDEHMMFEAFSAGLRSTCLSRQVGAAVADSNGDLLSIGWNDVPAFRGGVSTDNHADQASSLCKHKMRCRSELEKSALLSMAYYALKRAGLIKAKSTREAFEKTMKVAVTSSLIEFSRALHAEMEAILCAARNGRIGLRGGTLYVTTYPCDNCVKHILAAGIERVVYIEPYPKSRAKAFFSDMIVDDSSKDKSRKGLNLSQFVGIAPESYVTLFRQHGARKNSAGMLAKPTAMPMPRTSAYLDGFTLYESHIAREAADEEL